MKYKAIRQLMAAGEFRKALKHISGILQKNPNDSEAEELEAVCRNMVHIQEDCSGENETQTEKISAEEYFSVHFRRFMARSCRMIFSFLSRLPEKYQRSLKVDKFRLWEIKYTLESDAEKDLLWELLFWDSRRRRILFTSLIAVICSGMVLFLLLIFNSCDKYDYDTYKDFSELVRAAQDNDTDAQFELGQNFYYGKTVRKDLDQAVFWLYKAAKKRHPKAAELLQKILIEKDIPPPNESDKQRKSKDYSDSVPNHY